MLSLLLAGGLTVAASDTALRLPGTHLRLGTPLEHIAAYGEFGPAAKGANATPGFVPPPGALVMEGPARFFGIDAHATLAFVEHRLTVLRFTIDPISSHSVDYLEDQLRRLGLRRECLRRTATVRTCDWLGRTRLHVELDQGRLFADFTAPPPVAEPPKQALPPGAVAIDTAATVASARADTLWLATGNDSLPAPVAVTSCKPVRSAQARSQGVFGRVTVNVLVDTDGRVIDAQVERGIAALNDAALECARQFRFQPYLWRGRAWRFWHELPVTFLLD